MSYSYNQRKKAIKRAKKAVEKQRAAKPLYKAVR